MHVMMKMMMTAANTQHSGPGPIPTHNIVMSSHLRKDAPFSSPFYRWAKGGSGMQTDLPRATRLVNGRARI